MAERRNMKVKMHLRSVSCYLFVFTILEVAVKSQMSSNSNSHSFIQDNNDVRYLVDNIPVSMHKEFSSSPGVRVQSAKETAAMYSASNGNSNLKFEPSVLNFKQRHLGVPHHEKVTVLNLDSNKTIYMSSISGNTVHFHSSFFEDKIIPPLGNTSFNVVFLGREEGEVESCLFIHTSEGSFKYEVRGASIQSPYRLRPLSGVRLPLNASYSPVILMHNPHSTPLQLVEVYSSGGEFHLELPSGELEGPKHLWEIPAFLTKPVIRVRFQAQEQKNHTAYIRLKVNNSEEVLVVPLEVEVGSTAGLYCPDDLIDFGIGGNQDPPKQLRLMLRNSWKKPIRVQNIISTPVSKSLKIDFEPIKVPPDAKSPTQVAVLTYDWNAGLESGQVSGRIVVKSKQGGQKLVIPYMATVLLGGLIFDPHATRFRSDFTHTEARPFYIINNYKVPVAITNITLEEDAVKHFKLGRFAPTILKAGEKRHVIVIGVKDSAALPPDLKFQSKVIIHSNISTLSVPLLCYNGRLNLVVHSSGYNVKLKLGMIGSSSIKETYLAVVNKNPVSVTLDSWGTSLPNTIFRLVAVLPGNESTFLKGTWHKDVTIMPDSVVRPGHFAMFHVEVQAGIEVGLVGGNIWVRTEFETLEVEATYRVQPGSLQVTPQPVVFDNCFPGKVCVQPLVIKSQFGLAMTVKSVTAVPSDPRFSFTPSNTPQVAPGSTTNVGMLAWDAATSDSYLGLSKNITTEGVRLIDLLETDINLLNEQYNRYLNLSSHLLNLTMRLDTSQVRDFSFQASVHLTWPKLLVGGDNVKFPLTQIGNISYRDIIVVNPATRHAVLVQVVVEPGYPVVSGILNSIPEKLRPVCLSDCPESSNREFFVVTSTTPEAQRSSVGVFLMPPASNVTFKLGFSPTSVQASSALLLLRNNLTALEVIRVSGQGAHAQFKFGNRKPGSTTPLLFELAEKHLKDCEREKHRKSPAPNLTVKRSFTARNTGALPLSVFGFHISGLPCEGFGFRVLNCQPFLLAPNSTRKVDIAFTPDFTLARVQRMLSVWTSDGFEGKGGANYTLVATLPPYLLATCSSVLARPTWEPLLYYSAVTFMVFLLVCVLAAAFLESDRTLKCALLAMSRDSSIQPVLDLRLVAAGVGIGSSVSGLGSTLGNKGTNGGGGGAGSGPTASPADVSASSSSWTPGLQNSSLSDQEPLLKTEFDVSKSLLSSSGSSNSTMNGSMSGLGSVAGSGVSYGSGSSKKKQATDKLTVNKKNSDLSGGSGGGGGVPSHHELNVPSESSQRRGSWTNVFNSGRSQASSHHHHHQGQSGASSHLNQMHHHSGAKSSSSGSQHQNHLSLSSSSSSSLSSNSSSSSLSTTSSSCSSSSSSCSSSSSGKAGAAGPDPGTSRLMSELTAPPAKQLPHTSSHCSSSVSSLPTKCPLVPILRASDLNSSNNNINNSNNNNTSHTSNKDNGGGTNTGNNNKENKRAKAGVHNKNRKNNSGGGGGGVVCVGGGGVSKRVLETSLSNSSAGTGICSGEDGETSSTTTESSTHDETEKEHCRRGVERSSTKSSDSKCGGGRLRGGRNAGGGAAHDASLKKAENINSNNSSNNNGGSVSSLDGDEDENPEREQSLSSSAFSAKKPHNASRASRKAGGKSGAGGKSAEQVQVAVGGTSGANGKQSTLSKSSSSTAGGSASVKAGNGGGRSKEKPSLSKRRSAEKTSPVVLPKSVTETVPSPNIIRASFSDVVARTSIDSYSSVVAPRSTSLTCSTLSGSILSDGASIASSSNTVTAAPSSLGPIGPKKLRDPVWGHLDGVGSVGCNVASVAEQRQQAAGIGSSLFTDSFADQGITSSQVQGNSVGSYDSSVWSDTSTSSATSLVLKVLQEAENIQRQQQQQQQMSSFNETWPGVNSLWEPLYTPSSSSLSSAAVQPLETTGSLMWGSDVWAPTPPPTAPWAPPGLAPRPPGLTAPGTHRPTATGQNATDSIDQGLEYHPFRSLSNIWSPSPSAANPGIWHPPTTK